MHERQLTPIYHPCYIIRIISFVQYRYEVKLPFVQEYINMYELAISLKCAELKQAFYVS